MKINKYLEYFLTKLKVCIREKVFKSNDYEIRYILEKNESNDLLIVFSSCTRVGVKARYNYNRTLKNIKANKLFILDDFGYDKRGAFYLGKNFDFKIHDGVLELIKNISMELNIDKKIYIGSSKGGYAALLFGVQDNNSYIITGAPQYYLDIWLKSEVNKKTFEYIVGDIKDSKKVEHVRFLLANKIKQNYKNNNKIYLHYSKNEHTYDEHIISLINDLNKYNYSYSFDERDYTNHSDVSKFFPGFIIEKLNEIL